MKSKSKRIDRNAKMHLFYRVLFFFLGIILFYAPFAVLVRALLYFTGSPLVADAHRICLRMPFEWAMQPWMYPVMWKMPLFLIGLIGLPVVAFWLGPVFCGWLCPAGSCTEFVGKLVPNRFKLRLQGRVNPVPIRYGMLLGMMASPFLGGYVCCTFCNFTMMQNVVSAVFGDMSGFAAWASFTIVTFVLWFFVLGIFFRGGRGFCAFLCPAGAVQGLFHAWGARLGIGRSVQKISSHCRNCAACIDACPALAITEGGVVNHHACTVCLDCVHVCKNNALAYASENARNKRIEML